MMGGLITAAVTRLKALLASAAGAGIVGFIQAGAGAVLLTVAEVMRDRVTPEQFGAVGDGITDDTAAIQAAIAALPAGGTLDGRGKTYLVGALYLKSQMRMTAFRLKMKPGGVENDMVSPITIDGRDAAKSDIYLGDIHVDGNRVNQSAITATSEDGGRHGFRLVGLASRVYLERCSASYCAGDGIELFSASSHVLDDSYFVFNDIQIRDCTFNWNRRHGMSGDSIKGLRMDNVVLNYNGLDVGGGYALNHGGHAATIGANNDRYGNGIDMEGYGIGSAVTDIRMRQVFAQYNARGGCLFYDSVATRGAGFVARSKIWLSDCYFDEGQDATRTGEALTFTATIESKALAPLYDGVYVTNTRLDGHLLARGVSNLLFTGDIRATSGLYHTVLDYAAQAVIEVQPAGAAKLVYADNSTWAMGREAVPTPANPTLEYAAGVGGVLENITCVLLENCRNRTSRFLITAKWTAGAAGTPVFTVTPPAGAAIVAPPRVDVFSQATANPVLASYNLGGNNFRFSDPGTSAMLFQLVVDVKV